MANQAATAWSPWPLWILCLVHHFAPAEGVSCLKCLLLSGPQPGMFLPDVGNFLCSLNSVICSMRSTLTLYSKSEASSSPPCFAPIFPCFTFPHGIHHWPGYCFICVLGFLFVVCSCSAVSTGQDFCLLVPGCISEPRVAPATWQLLLFGCSVVSNSLRSHGLQHSRLPCPSLSPRVCSNSLSKWVHWVDDDIQPFHPLLPPSPPAISLSQNQGLFRWVTW